MAKIDSIAAAKATKAGGHSRKGKRSSEYHSWMMMKARCYNPNATGYDRYGGRGITVCERWRDSFVDFLEDMGPKPSSEYSIDRINNDAAYDPSNCKWSTRKQQQQNRTANRMLTHEGQTACMEEWARRIGISPKTLQNRLDAGWPVDKAVTTPRLPPNRSGGAQILTHGGETMSLQEWARRYNIQPATVYARLKKLGWSVEKALTTPTRQHK